MHSDYDRGDDDRGDDDDDNDGTDDDHEIAKRVACICYVTVYASLNMK
jgi:hypothetical protein